MTIETIAALVFAAATAIVVGFQFALALGAPWGASAMGGSIPGRYPPPMRVLAAVLGVVLTVVALVVLASAGVVDVPLVSAQPWLIWVIVALSVVGLVLNLLSRSAVERRTWVPVTTVMLVSSAIVALSG